MLSSIWNDFLKSQETHEQRNPILLSLLKQIKPLELSDEKIILGCENTGARMYLEKRKSQIELLLTQHLQRELQIEFTTEEKKQTKKEAPPLLQFQPSLDDLYLKSGLNPKYTFENFAVSPTNQVAFAAAQAVANSPGSSYNPLFLYGGVGVGKTHIAQSVARQILERNAEKKVFFCPGDQFTNELIESIREKSTARFRRKYRYLNLLIIDDIQFIAGKQTIQEEFFHTFNSIVSSGGQIILTSDRPPSDIKNLEDRLRSRFSGGLIVDVQPPDFELRTAILLIKAKEKNIPINIEAAKIIAETISDTRALEGTLLSMYAKAIGRTDKIDLDVVEDFFRERVKSPMQQKVTPQEVIRSVCSFYNIKQAHIKSSTRRSEIAMARQIIMYLLRVVFELKLEDVAYILKRKDHTTIMHGTDKIKRMLMKDTQFKEEIDAIVSSIRSST